MLFNTPVDIDEILYVSTSEKVPVVVDWTATLIPGETLTDPIATIYDTANGVYITNGFQPVMGINGSLAQYIVDGTKLMSGHTYAAVFQTRVSGKVKLAAQRLQVRVS